MIVLKPLSSNDLEYRVDLLNHSAIAPHINTKEVFTLEKTRSWFASIEFSLSRKDFLFMNGTNKVGMGGISNLSDTDKNGELYMYMDPKFHGKGFGYKACYALCEFAFNELDLEKVYLFTFSENIPANKLYEKIGFKLEGVLRKQTFKEGVLKDRNFYGILKNELK